MAGRFGRAKRLKTLVLWPRSKRYFGRSWAGKKRDREGRWILDSIANNAAAHFLHNMFYVLGDGLDRSAGLRQVTAELYRANGIENFDTAAIRAITTEGVEVLFVATHAAPTTVGPNLCFEFERATIRCESGPSGDTPELRALFADGTGHIYGDPTPDHAVKLWTCVEAVRGNGSIPCGIEAAMAQTICVNAAQESRPMIMDFPRELLRLRADPVPGAEVVYVDGLAEELTDCYRDWRLPSEGKGKAAWARAGRAIDVTDYRHFGEGWSA